MRRPLARSLSLSLLIALCGPALAQAGFGPTSTAAPRSVPRRRPIDELGLSPAQRRQLNVMRRTTHAEQSRLGSQVRTLRRQLADLYRAYPLDSTRASSLVDQISQLEAQRLRLQFQIQLELRRILTPEQFGRFTQLMESNQRPPASPLGRIP